MAAALEPRPMKTLRRMPGPAAAESWSSSRRWSGATSRAQPQLVAHILVKLEAKRIFEVGCGELNVLLLTQRPRTPPGSRPAARFNSSSPGPRVNDAVLKNASIVNDKLSRQSVQAFCPTSSSCARNVLIESKALFAASPKLSERRCPTVSAVGLTDPAPIAVGEGRIDRNTHGENPKSFQNFGVYTQSPLKA